jgi:hypothetical protein
LVTVTSTPGERAYIKLYATGFLLIANVGNVKWPKMVQKPFCKTNTRPIKAANA